MENRFLSFLLMLIFISGCEKEIHQNEYLPSKNYHYTEIDFSTLVKRQKVYVPIYSDIYIYSGSQTFPLTATLSIRNTSFTDTMYVGSVDYYDSEGHLTKEYLQNSIYVGPLGSVEFVVRADENRGGVGANFMVDWGTNSMTKKPVIQAVMIGDSNQQGISFLTEGVVVE